MVVEEIPIPQKPSQINRIFDNTEPLIRLKQMDEYEFERVVETWAYVCLKETKDYYNVVRIGGAKDAGRDLVAYFDSSYEKFDIYQCKHYEKPLSLSDYIIEFGKLCYYTYIKEYEVPINYYIVASNGIGPSLRKVLEMPKLINVELLKQWDSKCGKAGQIISKGIELDEDLKEYIEHFNFSIVDEVSPIKFLDEFSQTSWFKYYFGGGIKVRPKNEIFSTMVTEEEEILPYVKQLLDVYSVEDATKYKNTEELKKKSKWYEHFTRQREGFFSAQSLKRFARDELINEDSYQDLKSQINYGITDTYEQEYKSKLERVKKTTGKANELVLLSDEIKDIKIQDKTGMCHELVNDGKIYWSEDDENI